MGYKSEVAQELLVSKGQLMFDPIPIVVILKLPPLRHQLLKSQAEHKVKCARYLRPTKAFFFFQRKAVDRKVMFFFFFFLGGGGCGESLPLSVFLVDDMNIQRQPLFVFSAWVTL